jgi:hypothetical protein
MDEKRIPKWLVGSNIIGKRPIGNPRRRWINAMEMDNRGILKVRNWKRESLERQVWRHHLKEAKACMQLAMPWNKKTSIQPVGSQHSNGNGLTECDS